MSSAVAFQSVSSNIPNQSSTTASTSSNSQNRPSIHKNRTGKIIIPYDRWIRNDCKKWGHFKDFDFYNLILSSTLCTSISNNLASSNNSNIIIAINNNLNQSGVFVGRQYIFMYPMVYLCTYNVYTNSGPFFESKIIFVNAVLIFSSI